MVVGLGTLYVIVAMMKYHDYLKTLKKCPFCFDIRPRILVENDKAYLTYSLAPYHKYHLLVNPKRHIENIKDLSWEENICITALLSIGIKALDKIGHNDCVILVRDGQASGKSIKHHLHYHIIPGGQLEDISLKLEVRKLLSPAEEKSLKNELNKLLSQ